MQPARNCGTVAPGCVAGFVFIRWEVVKNLALSLVYRLQRTTQGCHTKCWALPLVVSEWRTSLRHSADSPPGLRACVSHMETKYKNFLLYKHWSHIREPCLVRVYYFVSPVSSRLDIEMLAFRGSMRPARRTRN